jgi:hypothetical protein
MEDVGTLVSLPRFVARTTYKKGLAVNCPYHAEKTPSCVMFTDADGHLELEGRWHCLGCQKVGFYAIFGETEPKGDYGGEIQYVFDEAPLSGLG